ncbi:MAG: septal ring lytic transglycosylase RlpA family protein [Cyanobacteriota bacterium]|nr:septal ring lytic transglycosylase RlpA family protein [Cyanobacteriota bacterium]
MVLFAAAGATLSFWQHSTALAASESLSPSSSLPNPAEGEPEAELQGQPEEVRTVDVDPAREPAIPAARAVPQAPVAVSHGRASWYGPGFFGNRTASGEVLRPGTLTAAHRSLPFGTRVRVTNLSNGRSAVVRINDRGPFHGNRVIDLAHGAAGRLGLISSGLADVRLEVLPRND